MVCMEGVGTGRALRYPGHDVGARRGASRGNRSLGPAMTGCILNVEDIECRDWGHGDYWEGE